ncbi:MAG: hypothetical protein IJD36_05960 [Clostridia bacterium]|nr:hypothetical protein [Clostridia bacterium]
MPKADKTVLKETKYIACWTIILSVLMQGIFLIISMWDYTVLLGNILSGGAMILNFFFMGLSVQKAVETDEQEARKIMRTSQTLRNFFIFVVLVAGVCAPCFSTIAVIIPLFFTRIAIALRPLLDKGVRRNEQ